MIKKYFYVGIGALMLFSTTIRAQEVLNETRVTEVKNETSTKGLLLGIRFMPTISSIKVLNSDGNSVNGNVVYSYGYGGLVGLDFNQHIGLQLEVLYNTLSQKYNDHTLDRHIDMNYVNVPVLLALNTNSNNIVNFNFVVGPQWGLNVGSKVETTGTGNGNSNTQAILAVKKNDLGIAYGAGLDFGGTLRIEIGFRGVAGLIDISDRSKTLETNSYYILQKKGSQTYQAYIGLNWVL